MGKVSIDIGSVTRSGKGRATKITGVSIEGLDELIQAFANLPEDMIFDLMDPSVAAARVVAARAKTKIRNRSGDLSRAITVIKPGKSSSKKAYRIFAKVTFKKKGMHGVPLELGHKTVSGDKVEAKPFLRPAADESRADVERIMADSMRKTIDNMGGLK